MCYNVILLEKLNDEWKCLCMQPSSSFIPPFKEKSYLYENPFPRPKHILKNIRVIQFLHPNFDFYCSNSFCQKMLINFYKLIYKLYA